MSEGCNSLNLDWNNTVRREIDKENLEKKKKRIYIGSSRNPA
jgi:hypothetical protein